MAPRVKLYGVTWEPLLSPVTVESTMIRRNGGWKLKGGGTAGNGLFFHFKRFQELVWPEHVRHRWNNLELECYLKYRIIGEMGPASSGKTRSAAINVLTDYYVWNDCTTILVSSTEREMLEMRVWGEIKKLHAIAKDRFPDLIPGNLIESRQRIITDSRYEDVDGRDFRNGICGVPCKKGGSYVGLGCFPAGTLVDTPTGPQFIECIKVGDLVKNAAGTSKVRETMIRRVSHLVRIHYSGRHFDCTPEHPILTSAGWIKAIDLNHTHHLICTDEAMRVLQEGNAQSVSTPALLLTPVQKPGKLFHETLKAASSVKTLHPMHALFPSGGWAEILFRKMSVRISEQEQDRRVCLLRETICEAQTQRTFLWQILRSEMEVESAGKGTLVCQDRLEESWPETQQNAASADWRWMAQKEGRNEGGESHPRLVPGSRLESYSGSSAPRFHVARHQVCSGDRRGTSPLWEASRVGQIEGTCSQCHGVDFVEVLQQRGDERYSASIGGYKVYNLEVESHPSYSVGGILVHNSFAGIKNRRLRMVADECHLMNRVFVDAISNLNKNPDFKCVALGNPKDTTDALGVICEPAAHLGGWDGGIDQGPKTKTWPTRFNQGICIQLVGSDSPNLDGKLGIPLITQEAMDADISFYGKESLQYTMMNEGRMPRGQGLRRVITRQMCTKFGAMEEPVWKNDQRTKVGFLDAAYGSIGGDRCVFGELQFGPDPNDKQILALIDTMLVPVSVELDEMPEDQIANFVRGQCEARGIPPQQFGFDSTGRGTLVGAFGRLWSPYVIPIEFGGKPTERPVTWLPTDQKITCRDYYSKFVTELWYCVSLAIQSGQFRGMTEEVMNEGCMREWGIVGANKIEVEPKDKMKLKTGRSPDLFDGLAAGVEMARRLGFIITMVRARGASIADDTWKKHYRERMERLENNHRLNYSTT